MASISDKVFSYTSNKSGNVVKGLKVVEGQYPWSLFSQECLRVLSVYKGFGPEGFTQIIRGFTTGQTFQGTDLFGYEEYQGHKLLAFYAHKGDKRGLKFGAGKAKGLLSLIDAFGVQALVSALNEVAGDAKASEFSPKGKKKGSAKPAKGKGGLTTEQRETLEEAGVEIESPKPVAATRTQAEDSYDSLMARKTALMKELFEVSLKLRAYQTVAV